MTDFFTWSILATYAGAVLATGVITQIFKGISVIDRIPTRLFSYFVALVLLILATAFTSGLSLSSILLCIINSAVVSLASNGAFDAITNTKVVYLNKNKKG